MFLSGELEVGDLCAVPAGVFGGAFKRGELAEAGLVDEAFLFALPQEVFVLFGQRTQVHVLVGVVVDQVFWVVLHGFAVCKQTRPHRRPVRVEHLPLRHIRTY